MNLTLGRLTRFVADQSREPDGRLLAAFLGGSQPAFRELVDRHGPLVFSVCNRILRHQQDAEDAFQAVFLVLARRAGDVWPQDAVGSWLHGVAYRVALKARTLRIRRRGREHPLVDVAQPAGPASEPDVAEVIDRAVRKLPEVYQAAVVACDLEGLSRKDAAGRLGWSEGTLSGRLARARRLLADRLRKAGFEFPAAGLAVTLGSNSPVRAGLPETVMHLTSTASGVPAPLVALTEGVVPTMFAFKLKATAAAMLVACTIGFGAWTAGAGDGPASGAAKEKGAAPPPASRLDTPNLTRAREELKLIEQELSTLLEESKSPGAKLTAEQVRRIQQAEDRLTEFRRLMAEARDQLKAIPEKPIKLDPALKQIEGRWRVESITSGQTVIPADPKTERVIAIAGNTLAMPYRESGGLMKQQEYRIAVDAKQTPKTIDLIQTGKPVGKGIYEFTAPADVCLKCHQLPFPDDGRVRKDSLNLCAPGLKFNTGLRLAISDGRPRPTQFGSAEGVIEFQLTRITPRIPEDPLTDVPDQARLQKRVEALLEAAARARDEAWLQGLLNESGPNASSRLLAARAALLQARFDEQQAKAQLEVMRAQVAQAQANLEQATRKLQLSQDRLAAAEKALAAPKSQPEPAGKDDPAFSIHIRGQLAAEKTVRVKITGTQTVLEGLAYAAEDMAIKPDAVTVWVVRNQVVLPVDLAAITQKGDPKTNHALKAGDQLFIQVKVGK